MYKIQYKKFNTQKTIGQSEINRLLAMYRCNMRNHASLDDWLRRMDRAWPEWNISVNHTNLYNYINRRCPDFNPEKQGETNQHENDRYGKKALRGARLGFRAPTGSGCEEKGKASQGLAAK